jgi:hypothetical protein
MLCIQIQNDMPQLGIVTDKFVCEGFFFARPQSMIKIFLHPYGWSMQKPEAPFNNLDEIATAINSHPLPNLEALRDEYLEFIADIEADQDQEYAQMLRDIEDERDNEAAYREEQRNAWRYISHPDMVDLI